MSVPENAQSPPDWVDRFGWLIFLPVRAYWYVFVIFASAGVAALLVNPIDWAVGRFVWENWPVRGAQHTAWVAGAVFMAVGYPLGWYRIFLGKSRAGTPPASQEAMKQPTTEERPGRTKPSLGTYLQNSLGGGLIGLCLGTLVGGTLIGTWFSVALSPWAPAEWANSLTIIWPGVSTNHPLTIPLFLGPVIILVAVGFLLGLFGTPFGWVRVNSPRRAKD